MARAATETQRAGLTGLEFGLAIPGTVGGAVWANAGAHDADVAGVLESARVLAADGTEAIVAGRRPRLRLPRQPVQAAAPPVRARPRRRHRRHVPPGDRPTPRLIKARLDEIRHWRQAHQPLGLPSAGSVFRNPPGDSAGRLIDAAGLKGTRIGGAVVSEKHANFIVNDQKGTADGRPPPRRAGPRRRSWPATASTSRFEIEFVGDWSGVGDRARDRRDHARPVVVLLGGPSAEHDVSIVSGTAIAEALAERGLRRRAGPHRPRRRRGGGCPPTTAATAARPPPTTTRPRSAREGPLTVGAAIDRLAGDPTRRPSCSSPSTARSARTGRSRRCSRRPAWPTPGPASRPRRSAWTRRCSSGCAAGIGLPVVDWREVRARRWARDPAAVRAELDGLRRRRPPTRG